MTKKFFYLFLFFTAACDQNKGSSKIENDNLVYRPGDCIAFKTDSNFYGAAAVYDIRKDKIGTWYGMCFLDYAGAVPPKMEQLRNSRLSGRKVENDLAANGYVIGIDIEWLTDSCLRGNKEKTIFVGQYEFKPMEVMSDGESAEYDRFLLAYKLSTQRRQSPPDHYSSYRQKQGSEFRPEEFFPIKDFIKNGN